MSTELTADAVAPTGANGVHPPPAPNPLDEPTADECYAEWGRYYEYPQELIPPGHSDDFIAFYDGQPRGYDPDPTALLERVAAELGVHPARIVITYLGPYIRPW